MLKVPVSATKFKWREAYIPLGISIAIVFIAQRWSGLDTPDSSFYISLALFGDEITDRVPFDSYYWTRLGYIGPVALLTSMFGTWEGFLLYKALLTLIVAASTYVIFRHVVPPSMAAWLTAGVVSSTVILSYLGNSFPTGTVLAGTSLVIACAITPGRAPLATFAAGLTLGWLVMVNPPGALLSGSLFIALSIHTLCRPHIRRESRAIPTLIWRSLALATGFLVSFAGYLIVGRIMFPGLNWFDTYLDATSINLSNFSSTGLVWLGDISLLVPGAILIICVGNWWSSRQDAASQRALIISLTSVCFSLTFNPMMGGIALEAPMYQAMLWPPALLALGLVAASRCRSTSQMTWTSLVVAILGLTAILIAGYLTPGSPWIIGLVVTIALVLAIQLAPRTTTSTLVVIATFLTTAQLLQNSRDDIGLYYLSPYHWAYASNPIEDKVRTAVNSQEWLLETTDRSDTLLLWVDGPWAAGDRELYVVAGMQLWGENRLTLEPKISDDYGLTKLNAIQPSVLVLYGKSMDAVMDFWASLPQQNDPTAPICYDYKWPPDVSSEFPTTQGHTCITRLTWPSSQN